jgi:replicative DNA helicase
MYIPLKDDELSYVENHIISTIQDRMINDLTDEYVEGKIDPKQFFEKVDTISQIQNQGLSFEDSQAGFMYRDLGKFTDTHIQGHPTFLHDLNQLTAAGGFYSPQLIVFMSGPKAFKTGFLINFAVNFWRDGLNVYYADGENGENSIRNRVKQTIMSCELMDLNDPDVKEEVDELTTRIHNYRGGDLYIRNYPALTASVLTVDKDLERLKETYNWVPDVIVWDSLDHFIPSKSDDQKRDTRIQSRIVYFEAIALNKKHNVFAIAPSQVNRAAISKKVFSMKDIAEDFSKIMNAHGIFAICATEEEEEMGIKRIIPVAQREGKKYKGSNLCIVKVDEEKMKISEVDKEQYLNVNDD